MNTAHHKPSIPASLFLGSVTALALVSSGSHRTAAGVAVVYVTAVYLERFVREVDLDNQAMPSRMRKSWTRPLWFACFLLKGAVVIGAPLLVYGGAL